MLETLLLPKTRTGTRALANNTREMASQKIFGLPKAVLTYVQILHMQLILQ